MPTPPDDDRQQRHHEHAREDARQHELANRIGAERPQRGNLLRHHHEPSSAAMPEPTRPATISPVSTGPSSLTIEALTSRPTIERAPNCRA